MQLSETEKEGFVLKAVSIMYKKTKSRISSGSIKHHVLCGGEQNKMQNEMGNMKEKISLLVTSSSSSTTTLLLLFIFLAQKC